jgi:hypothetical protein
MRLNQGPDPFPWPQEVNVKSDEQYATNDRYGREHGGDQYFRASQHCGLLGDVAGDERQRRQHHDEKDHVGFRPDDAPE